jgi:hypothetical protein
MSKLLANLSVLTGVASAITVLLTAFGVDITDAQKEAILGVVAVLVTVAGVWFHPSTPIGPGPTPPDA